MEKSSNNLCSWTRLGLEAGHGTHQVFFSSQVKYTGVDIVNHVIEDSLGWLVK